MTWLIAAAVIGLLALIYGAIFFREGWRRGGEVEMPGGETIGPPDAANRIAHLTSRSRSRD